MPFIPDVTVFDLFEKFLDAVQSVVPLVPVKRYAEFSLGLLRELRAPFRDTLAGSVYLRLSIRRAFDHVDPVVNIRQLLQVSKHFMLYDVWKGRKPLREHVYVAYPKLPIFAAVALEDFESQNNQGRVIARCLAVE